MSTAPVSPNSSTLRRPRIGVVLFGLAVLIGAGIVAAAAWPDSRLSAGVKPAQEKAEREATKNDDQGDGRIEAPELDGGVAWLNTAGPIRLKDLKGKIVILDFWTFCCINCIHTLPDLANLEKKYPNQLVVIGVHSAKFENERVTDNIRKAILRYEISHPVVNDANMRIWRTYGVESWPTLGLIDPEGYVVRGFAGEGNYEKLDSLIGQLIDLHRKRKTLDEKPMKFQLARFSENGDSPLFFPGKVLADGASKRLIIADSTHHRIVITDLEGNKIAIAGDGQPGWKDGTFAQARFNDPQGMALKGDTLYVADRKNHLIRALNLKDGIVSAVAGTGLQSQERRRGGPALKKALNSPWDLYLQGDTLYIALAGHHQLWTLDVGRSTVEPYAGNGLELIVDGDFRLASFAQPSGLASDGSALYVADSEGSVIRRVGLGGKGEVQTFIGYECGRNLFDFGDHDGIGEDVRLQHALGVAFHGGKLYVADTYNSKIKVVDPAKRSCITLIGGERDGWLAGPVFHEPGGLSAADGKLYVADTNAHRIRVVDLKSNTVSTLKLHGVEAPKAKTP
ncbi:MAG TPA: thioredoxin-like domain-containing protein [Gemmataceae bacterium]|nr:thioredoxin-like domain-containing protein [Gemmataceae bacterium]